MKDQNRDRIWELAAAKMHNEITNAELKELELLLLSEDNKKIEHCAKDIYETLVGTKSLKYSSLEKSWQSINDYFKRKQTKILMNFVKYAAVIFIALLAGFFLNYLTSDNFNKHPVCTSMKVPLGQMAEVSLYDGTRVWLNSGTLLRYNNEFGVKNREVLIEGEAFFKVVPDKMPFRVNIKENVINVLGTSFSVIGYPEDDYSQITLVEGKIRINDTSGRIFPDIQHSQQLKIPDDPLKEVSVKSVDTKFYDSWIEGKIIFNDECLSEVARRLERWYNVEIQFDNEEIRNLRFSGTILKNKPFDQIITALGLLLPVNIKYQNNLEFKDVITISKK